MFANKFSNLHTALPTIFRCGLKIYYPQWDKYWRHVCLGKMCMKLTVHPIYLLVFPPLMTTVLLWICLRCQCNSFPAVSCLCGALQGQGDVRGVHHLWGPSLWLVYNGEQVRHAKPSLSFLTNTWSRRVWIGSSSLSVSVLLWL